MLLRSLHSLVRCAGCFRFGQAQHRETSTSGSCGQWRARYFPEDNSLQLAYDRCGTVTSQLVSQCLCTPLPLPPHRQAAARSARRSRTYRGRWRCCCSFSSNPVHQPASRPPWTVPQLRPRRATQMQMRTRGRGSLSARRCCSLCSSRPLGRGVAARSGRPPRGDWASGALAC